MRNAREVLKGISVRIENRPIADDLEQKRRFFKQSGVKALVSSALGSIRRPEYYGSPKYRSNVPGFEMHPDADPAYLPGLVKMAGEEGIVLLSWFPLTHIWAGGHSHPEWLYQTAPDNQRSSHSTCCLLSTGYLDFVSAISQEIVTSVGFDGVWFDGTAVSEMFGKPPGVFGCACDGCRRNFKRETGMALPERWNWNDKAFRAFVRWTYQRKHWALEELTRRILAVRPDAAIYFNNSSVGPQPHGGKSLDWRVNWPLDAAPVAGALRGDEAGDFGMPELLHARLGAAACPGEFDVWRPMQSLALPWNSAFTPPLEENLLHTFTQIANGGNSFLGCGCLDENTAPVLKRIVDEAELREPWRGGEPLHHLAIHLSQATRDFGGRDDAGAYLKPWLGAYDLAAGCGIPLSVIFDSQLTREHLAKVRCLFLPESACLSDEQAKQIEEFVENGGTLIATGVTGTLDEEGESRPVGVLDHLLGIDRGLTAGLRWMIVGPFDNTDSKGFDIAYGPEQGAVNLEAEYEGLGGGTVRWKPYPLPGNEVDFLDQFKVKEWVCAYAYTTVRSEKEIDAKLLVASDDGCKVWLNGNLVDSVLKSRGVYEEVDAVPVRLRKGENKILIKVEQRFWGWGFMLQVVSPETPTKLFQQSFCPVAPVDGDMRGAPDSWVWLGDKKFPFAIKDRSSAEALAYFLREDVDPKHISVSEPIACRGAKPAASLRHFGKGEAIYIGLDLGECQLKFPEQNQRGFFRHLACGKGAPVSVKAPGSVEVFTFWKKNRLVCHLLNRPLTSMRPVIMAKLKPVLTSPPLLAEVELVLRCAKRPAKVINALTSEKLKLTRNADSSSWSAQVQVERHEIVVVDGIGF